MFNNLHRLWAHISNRFKHRIYGLVLLMVFVGFAEMASIGAVLPFLGVLVAPQYIFTHPRLQAVFQFFHIHSASEILYPIAGLFMGVIFASTTIRMLLVWLTARVSATIGIELNKAVYAITLHRPYLYHAQHNSSEIISGILNKASSIVTGMIIPALNILSSLIILTIVFTGLLTVSFKVSLSAIVIFGTLYFLVASFAKKRLFQDGEIVAREQNLLVKIMQESLGGIRDIILDGTQGVFYRLYSVADWRVRTAQARQQVISNSPKVIIESLGMIAITLLALWIMNEPNGSAKVLPILGMLAMGAQRLLPILQQVYLSWATIVANNPSLNEILNILENDSKDSVLPDNNLQIVPMKFRNAIRFENIEFTYSQELPPVIHDLQLKINKGEKIGIIGQTGSGKSTLVDILMGLLTSSAGQILVDDQPLDKSNILSWQKCIAHVPQAIFLADTTVAENIAFGVPQEFIDHERVVKAAKFAQIAETIDNWPLKYQTVVGERGVRLSGGQRQRIGLARALYKNAQVIILDEATSALDSETETAVMECIDNLDDSLTLIMIAHRITTLRNCDRIIELNNGSISRIDNYQNIVNEGVNQKKLVETV